MVQPARFYGWKLLAVLWIIIVVNLAFPFYGAGLIGAYMARDLHLSRNTLGLSFGIFQWVSALPSPLVAICINKKGVRFTLFLGSIVLCLGALLMACLVRSGLQVDIVLGVVVATGVLTAGIVATQTAAGRWFEKRKALAISLLFTGPFIGGFIAAPVLNWVIVKHGGNWRAGWGLISVLSLLAAVLVLVFVKEWPSDLGQFPDGLPPASSPAISTGVGAPAKRSVYHTAEDWSVAEALRTRALWLILIAEMGFGSAQGAVVGHGVVHFMDLGHTGSEAAFALSILCLASLAGTLLVAALGDRIEPRLIFCVASSFVGVGLLLAINATGMVSLYLCVTLIGAAGACNPCVFAMSGNYFGNKAYAFIVGLLCAFGPTAGAIGAWGAGYAYSQLGSYRPAFSIVAAACFSGSVIALLTTPPIRRAFAASSPEMIFTGANSFKPSRPQKETAKHPADKGTLLQETPRQFDANSFEEKD
jgi:MFS family permease